MMADAGLLAPDVRARARRLARHLPPSVRQALKRAPSVRRRDVAAPPSAVERALRQLAASHAADLRGEILAQAGLRDLAVGHVHVVDADVRNTELTVLADLTVPGSLPPARFDCILLAEAGDAAVVNAWRALAPGGVLLAAGAAPPPDLPGSTGRQLETREGVVCARIVKER